MLTHFEITTLILTVISVLLIPAVAFLIRGAIKWTRTEDNVAHLVDKVSQLVDDKDKIHTEIYMQMQHDRDATNRRLEYLERAWMERGKR